MQTPTRQDGYPFSLSCQVRSSVCNSVKGIDAFLGRENLIVADAAFKGKVWGCFRRPSSTFVLRCGSEEDPQERPRGATGRNGPSALACANAPLSSSPKGARYDQRFKDQVVAASQDRMSLRGITRTFGGLPQGPSLRWVGEKSGGVCPAFVDTLLPAAKGDVLELDELWSFVGAKACQPSGCGWRSVGAPARSSPGAWATAACNRVPGDLRAALPQRLPGPRHAQRSSGEAYAGRVLGQNAPLLSASTKARPTTSSVGSAPCERERSGPSCVGPSSCPSPNTAENHLDAIHLFITNYNLCHPTQSNSQVATTVTWKLAKRASPPGGGSRNRSSQGATFCA